MSAPAPPRLVLASASPRRRELLARAGVPFTVASADLDETRRPGEPPRAYAERLAGEKARACATPGAWTLGADTVVILGDDILDKPPDEAGARAVLERLAGHTHVVVTACCLLAPDGRELRVTVETDVAMRRLSPAEIAAYVASGEWRGKAGGYAAQGIAAAFIPEIRGSYTNVVGLPLSEVLELLARAGAPSGDLARGVSA